MRLTVARRLRGNIDKINDYTITLTGAPRAQRIVQVGTIWKTIRCRELLYWKTVSLLRRCSTYVFRRVSVRRLDVDRAGRTRSNLIKPPERNEPLRARRFPPITGATFTRYAPRNRHANMNSKFVAARIVETVRGTGEAVYRRASERG